MWYIIHKRGVQKIAIQGYFDGTSCIPLEKNRFLPQQKVIITALDEFIEPPKMKLSDFFGCMDKTDSDKMLEAIKDCERIEDSSEW